jgi:hypothetical protein
MITNQVCGAMTSGMSDENISPQKYLVNTAQVMIFTYELLLTSLVAVSGNMSEKQNRSK